MSGVAQAEANNNPWLGRFGTVYVSSEEFNATTANTLNAIYGSYVHESGNILDARLNPYSPQGQYEHNYGNPHDPNDTDTGAALKTCVFGSMQYP